MESSLLQLSNLALLLCGVALLVAGACLIHSNGKLSDFLIVLGLLNLPAGTLIGSALMGLAAAKPARLDLYINRIDGLLGYPSNRAAMLIANHPQIRVALIFDYHFYWVPLILGLLLIARTDVGEAYLGMASCFLSGLISIPIFIMFPVCGPRYALPNFPEIYRGPVHAQVIHSIPNCLPSIHFATALLSLWFLRRSKAGMILGIAHVGLTAFATLGLGLHYFFDLVVAVPYAAAMIAIPVFAKRSYLRVSKIPTLVRKLPSEQ